MGDPASRPQSVIGIVEDDPAVLHSLEFALQAEGYLVSPLTSAEAHGSVGILDVDCVIVDYGLCDGTGAALLASLRERGLDCPAIVIASNPSRRCIEECRVAGAPLVEKPLMGDDLSAHIRSALAG